MNDAKRPPEDHTPPWRAGLLLAAMAVIGVGLLSAVHELTADRIAAKQRQQMLDRLAEVLPPSYYDNDLLVDRISVTAPGALGHGQPVSVYRARRDGEVTAVIMEVIAPNGYNGPIRLLAGIDRQGVITGVRVVSHRETPGLGDPIEARRSDWIEDFDGRGLGDPPLPQWTVRKDGGAFDQFTGATITPRAVARALGRALAWFEDQKTQLFAREAESDGNE